MSKLVTVEWFAPVLALSLCLHRAQLTHHRSFAWSSQFGWCTVTDPLLLSKMTNLEISSQTWTIRLRSHHTLQCHKMSKQYLTCVGLRLLQFLRFVLSYFTMIWHWSCLRLIRGSSISVLTVGHRLMSSRLLVSLSTGPAQMAILDQQYLTLSSVWLNF